MNRTGYSLLLFVCLGILHSVVAIAQMPRTISFQGLLTDATGSPVSDGSHTLVVKLYDASGSSLYSETQSVTTLRGVFSAVIGSTVLLPASLSFDRPYLLGLSVDGGSELTPRTPLTAVPYAFYAQVAEQARSLAPGATGAVTSIDSATGAIKLQGAGGTTVSRSGNTITISSMPDSGSGVSTLLNSDGSIAITNASGPFADISVANAGITTAKIADGAVSPAKINPGTASTGNSIIYNGSYVTWGTPNAFLILPYDDSYQANGDAFRLTAAGIGNAIIGRSIAASGSVAGVVGEVSSASSGTGGSNGVSGVLGRVAITAPGGYSAGVRGVNSGAGSNGAGVIGFQAGNGAGVYGETPSGVGVHGMVSDTTAANAGVRGETSSPAGSGVEAKYSGSGTGIALKLTNGTIKVAGPTKAAFVHTATVANKIDPIGTDIDNPLTNGDPTAILIVTQVVPSSSPVYNRSPIGITYNTTRGKWVIINENNSAVVTGAQFNVLVIKQ